MTDIAEEWIPVEEVARLLGVKTRQAHRYGEGPNPRIRAQMMGHRKLFHRGDTEALAQERKAAGHLRPQRPKTELVPANEMLEYIRERDARLEDMQRHLTEAAAQVGYLRGQLEQRLLPEDAAKLRQEIDQLKRERDELKARLGEQDGRKPWWVRWLRRKMT